MFIGACIITINDVDSFIFEDHDGALIKTLRLIKSHQKILELCCGIVGSGYPDQITMVTMEWDHVHKELVTPVSQKMKDWIDECVRGIIICE